MVVNFDEIAFEESTAPRGGKGKATIYPYVALREIKGTIKAFNMMSLEVGSAIGYHKHEADMEAYILLDGVGKYNDNGVETTVEAGDLMINNKGESHALENIGDTELMFMAVIIES